MVCTKRQFSFFLWLTVAIQAFADGSFCENGFTYTIMKDNSSLSLTSYQAIPEVDYSQPLHIPVSVTHEGNTYFVKQIGSKAFKDVTEVQSVVIDEGIEQIGHYAFDCCTNLKSISFPASVEDFGEGLFGSCYNLVSVVVDAKNESYDSRDNSNAIIDSDNDELLVACSSTKIPSSVKSIGNNAFYHCNMIEQLVIPEGIERIGNDAFFGCSSLKSISLPESLIAIGSEVFVGCNSLTSIVIPKNVAKISEGNIFRACNNLTSVVVDSANPIYDSRSNCNGIVRKSDSALIATCRTTTISNDICIIDGYCFSGTVIHSLDIPRSVVKISGNVFEGCNEIDAIHVASDNPVYITPEGSNAILSRDGKTLLLGCCTTIIPEGIERIEDNAFTGRYSNLVLYIPETVRTIGSFAFNGCNALCEVIIPSSVQSIGSYAFSGCANLSVAQILAPVNTIAYGTFSGCCRLSSVDLHEDIETIAGYAFKNCKSLKHISLPSSVKNIDRTAFVGCPIYDKEMK